MHCTILVMGIMRNIHVKLFQTWTCCFDVLLFLALVAILFDGAEPFVCHMGNFM